jgi:hypothetical protein
MYVEGYCLFNGVCVELQRQRTKQSLASLDSVVPTTVISMQKM